MKRIYLQLAASIIFCNSIAIAQNVPNGTTVSDLYTQTNTITPPAAFPAASVFNYQQVYTPQSPVSDETLLTPTTNTSYVKLNTTYFDGFNRRMQNIKRYGSFNKDIVTPFDNRLQPGQLSFMSYPTSPMSAFHNDPYNEQNAYYTAKFPDEGNFTAVSQNDHIVDPDNPLTYADYRYNPGIGGVGQAKGLKMSLSTNGANEVIMWDIDPATSWPRKMGYYPAGSLYKRINTTADGGFTAEFYDIDNKLIAKRILSQVIDCSYSPADPGDGSASEAASHLTSSTTSPNPLNSESPLDIKVAMDNDNNSFALRALADGVGFIIPRILPEVDPLGPKGNPVQDFGTYTLPGSGIKVHFNTSCPTYIMTYYVYDVYDRLTFTLHPKAVKYLSTAGWAPNATIINNLCDYVQYDDYGRVVEKHLAGQSNNEQFVYDNHSRITMHSMPNSTGDWVWQHYDCVDRIIETGKLSNATSRSTIQSWFDNHALVPYENVPSSVFYYLYNDPQQGIYPTVALSSAEIHLINFYDHYSYANYFDGSSVQLLGFTYVPSLFSGHTLSTTAAAAPPSSLNQNTHGMLTYRVSMIFKPFPISTLTNFVSEALYYDEYGRVVQNERKNAFGGTDFLSTQYDFSGRVLSKINYYSNPLSTTNPYTHTFTHYNYSTRTLNLTSITQSVDDQPEKTVAAYTYDDNNKISGKTIGDIEHQKYTYNIREQLTGINPAYAESGNAEGWPVTFGESIKYDAGFTNNLICGNITGTIWKLAGYPSQSYGYRYDLAGRLVQSDFRELSGGGILAGYDAVTHIPFYTCDVWNNTNHDYTEGGIRYDFNGNITNLVRYGLANDGSSSHFGVIDNLAYIYKDGDISNQIRKVNDGINALSTSATPYDFKDGTPSADDYSYDNNGNLTADVNGKNVTTSYYYFNKPQTRTFVTSGDQESFVYDAFGTKIEEIKQVGTTTTITDQNGELKYEGNNLKMVSNQEGYSVPAPTSSSPSNYNYFYVVRDHLNNVRNVLYADPETGPIYVTYKATHESSNAKEEEALFDNIPLVRADKPLSKDPHDAYTATVDAADKGRTTGTSLLLKVTAGDQFDISAESFFSGSDVSRGNIDIEKIVGSLLSSYNTNFGQIGGPEQKAHLDMVNNLFTADNINTYSSLTDTLVDTTIPQAFVNYVFFDDDFHIIADKCGRIQIGGKPDVWNAINNTDKIQVRTHGYVLIYVSTATSGVPVSVDNLTVTHYQSALKDQNHYYPYGLAVKLLTHTPDATNPENKNLYQSTEQDETNMLYIDDFHARQYDPQLGRFLSLDPADQFASGYTGMGDNPVYFMDPTGMIAEKKDPALKCISEEDVAGDIHYSNASAEEMQARFDAGLIGDNTVWTAPDGQMFIYQASDNKVYSFAPTENGSTANGPGDFIFSPAADYNPGQQADYSVAKTTWTYLNLAVNAGGAYTSLTGEGLHNEYYWLQKNGRFVARNAMTKNNYLYNRSYQIAEAELSGVKAASTRLAVVGVVLSAVNYASDPTDANAFDVAMSATAFIPGVGWAISTAYFLANTVDQAVTGKTIGQQIFGDSHHLADLF